MLVMICNKQVVPIKIPCQPGTIVTCQRSGISTNSPIDQISKTKAIEYDQNTEVIYSA